MLLDSPVANSPPVEMDIKDVDVAPPPKSLMDWLDLKFVLAPTSANTKRAKSANRKSARIAAKNGVAENVGILNSRWKAVGGRR